MGITRFVLKRPVTVLMVLLCLVVFGISSVFNATLEQMPDTDQPMLIVTATYSGASPEDIDELVTEPIEDQVSSLEGVKSISSSSSEGRSRVMLEYDYGQDMDDAYNDLVKSLDSIRDLPDDVEYSVMEMNSNASASMTLTVYNSAQEDNLYDYVDQNIIPEIEKLSSVAEVETRGGSSQYVKIELQSDMMVQYGLTVDDIATAMDAANLSYPSGEAIAGNQELTVSTQTDHSTFQELLTVPIMLDDGKIVYLEDIANVYYAEEQQGGISRYNGEETISLSITKQQSSTAIEMSNEVQEAIAELMAEDSDLRIEIARDEADSIISSLQDVAVTIVLAVLISMVVIFLFFGDYKASLIVGSSIPTSILMSLIAMTSAGFSLNVLSMSGLALGVGMMVDNSIVVLESCFRAMDAQEDKGGLAYAKAALEGTNIVVASIFGSTVTTCVVFIPLVFLQGMSGQMFGTMGYTIVFCMVASFFSAIAIVPLTYMMYKPHETDRAPMSAPVRRLQNLYRRVMPGILKYRVIVLIASFGLVAAALKLASGMETELMTSDDTGTVSVTIETRPGLVSELADEMLRQVEEIVASHPDVESYVLRYNDDSGTVTAYLKDDREMSTDEVTAQWEIEMADIENCTIEVEASSSMSFMGRQSDYEVILNGSDYDEMSELSNELITLLTARDDVRNVHSSIENTAPLVAIEVDLVAAAAEGLTSTNIGSQVKAYMDGTEVATLTENGNEVSVMAEYPDGEYDTVPQLERMLIQNGNGGYVALSDVAKIYFKDSPSSIEKEDKDYQVTITANYVSGNVESVINSEVIQPNLPSGVTIGVNSRNRMMAEEFSALYQAIAVAVFLIFVVMSAQFESPKFSFMVMTTIPFSLVGSFGLLKLTGVSISMTSILGFLILVGTVVNNGILYVDTVNQNRMTMPLVDSMIEAGATRMRPILMTSLTTILAMIPMATAMGSSGSTTQGLAVVNIGGLSVGVFVALFILPVYYQVMNGSRERKVLDI